MVPPLVEPVFAKTGSTVILGTRVMRSNRKGIMNRSFGLRQFFWIRLRIHFSWLIAIGLGTAIVVTQFPETYSLVQRIIFGIIGGLLFFLAVLVRELILNFLAISKGIQVRRVTLFVFGGVYQVPEESTSPDVERLMSVAGLLTNLIIIAALYVVYLISVTRSTLIVNLFQWLVFIYFTLALFHFIPAFPLDGGRFLRVFLWRATGDYYRATRIACWVGWGIGLLALFGGILMLIFGQEWFVGLLLVLMGWVLQLGATQSRRRAALHEALRGVTARAVMNTE
jgi:Zn-dependent protease